MSDHIKSFHLSDCELGDQNYKRVLLQIYGLLGNGKSSFINSCKFVLEDGEFQLCAETESLFGGLTTHRIPYKLTDTIWMVDNRGMPTLDRVETGQIFAQLGNLVPLNEMVEWCKDFKQNVKQLLEGHKKDNSSDFIVPVFIHSVRNTIPEQEIPVYKALLETSQEMTGVIPLIVLTHKNVGGVETMRTVFKNMGMDKIYALENYTVQNHQETREKHQEIHNFLTEVIEDVKFCMKYRRDPKDESYKRLEFLIEYMKANDDQRKEEQSRKEIEAAKDTEKGRKCSIL